MHECLWIRPDNGTDKKLDIHLALARRGLELALSAASLSCLSFAGLASGCCTAELETARSISIGLGPGLL
jgi:hypothetical protein